MIQDLVMSHYKKRNFLAIYQDEMLGTYIQNEAAEIASKNGIEIFSSKENFDVFESGFRKNIIECEAYIKKAKEADTVSIGDFYDLRALIQKTYYFFEKTEFFFTDACYKIEMSDILKKNLFVLGDDLKMKSRPLFIELATTILYRYAEIVARQHSLEKEDVKFYSIDEVVSLMETGKTVDQQIVSERQKSYVLYSENDCVIPIEGAEKEVILGRFKEKDYSGTQEFKGTIASKGKVIAKARVILAELNEDYDAFVKKVYSMEMNKGEILVTETTSPDFVPLMKKAGGIIANQGGLNSHAAIMSRELGVPCLVGTHNATDILKTGDLIELDADKGVVRIIEKA